MTDKQQQILNCALKMMAKQGYEATSTRSIAEEAGVSEGLIFKHFQSKEGLLKILIQQGQKRFEERIEPIEKLSHPKVILKHIISLPFNMEEDQKYYWILFYSLRWQMDFDKNGFLIKLSHKVSQAFEVLDLDDPKAEAEAFMLIWDGAMILNLRYQPNNAFVVFETLLDKFDL